MPITASDIQYRLSTLNGSAGNTQPGTPAASLGKYASTTALSSTPLGALFDDITGDQAAAGEVDYRCVFVHNAHATLTLIGPVVWVTSQTSGGSDVAISVDTTAASAVGSASAQAKQVADEHTAPASQTFSTPTSKGTGLAIGDLAPGQVRGIWFRRTTPAGTGASNLDDVQWRVEGDTAA